MKRNNVVELKSPEAVAESRSVLEEIVRAGARRMLQVALEGEVADFVEQFSDMVNEEGRRMVVRNGYLPERDLVSGIGPIAVWR